ncbi:homoserine kinase [Corallincola holothuriorum]|uniref:Homoserine kinase n=1 Tax=Corallincola holothuriorum TaxID=2282215 RepID=A0A368NN22_9GAMM|nr:homoserine kinase [Corallincola holothuriorum]RCU51808.1 homoserine kinase [Corallincola holothuriorum]
MGLNVYAPASIGNLSVGFDILGAALSPIDGSLLGDSVSIESSTTGDFSLQCVGRFVDKLPADPKQNIIYDCYLAFRKAMADMGRTDEVAVSMVLEKHLPIGSGLGSSASSIVAAFYALNEHYGKPFSEAQLLAMMGELEGQISGSIHYDNVAPCYLGGIQLMLERDGRISESLPVIEDWYFVSAYPGISISTAEARSILPNHYSRADIIDHGRYLGTFIHALYRGDGQLAAESIRDVVAEPYRKQLIPGFDAMREQMMADGALAVGISGSGPSVFVITDSKEKAEQMHRWMQANFIQNDRGFSHVCQIDTLGTRVLEETA